MKLHTRQLTCAAIVGAAYAVLSIFGSIFGITYGPIQCRFSEALCVLPFLLPETAWGLGVGCLIANLLSPYGVLDIVVGSAATLLAALLTARCKKKWLAPLPPVLANMVLVGLVLAYEQAGYHRGLLAHLRLQRPDRGCRRDRGLLRPWHAAAVASGKEQGPAELPAKPLNAGKNRKNIGKST